MTFNVYYTNGLFSQDCAAINDGKNILIVKDWFFEKVNNYVVVSNLDTGIYYKYPAKDGSINICYSRNGTYVYFRDLKLLQFILKYKLDTIKKCNPNMVYYVDMSNFNEKKCKYKLVTDGLAKEEIVSISKENSANISLDCKLRYTVTDATFVYLKRNRYIKGMNIRKISIILYTELSIENIDKMLNELLNLTNSNLGSLVDRRCLQLE